MRARLLALVLLTGCQVDLPVHGDVTVTHKVDITSVVSYFEYLCKGDKECVESTIEDFSKFVSHLN